MAAKYFTVDSVATIVHHRGPTTLPGQAPAPADGPTVLCLHDVAGNGNVFAGENMLETMGRMVPGLGWLLPIPFYFMELLVGLVQAMVFMLLNRKCGRMRACNALIRARDSSTIERRHWCAT